MRMFYRFGTAVKDLIAFLWHVSRGGRHCYRGGCGRFAPTPHKAWGHPFCDRLCAASWKRSVEVTNQVSLEQRARESGS